MKNKIILCGLLITSLFFAQVAFSATAKKAAAPTVKKNTAVAVTKVKAIDRESQQALLDRVYKMPNNTIIAEINGLPITKGELMEAMWNSAALSTLSELVEKKTIVQAAKKEGVVVTQKEIDDKIMSLLAQSKIYDAENFFREKGISSKKLSSDMQVEMLMQKYGERKFKLSPKDVEGYVKASHILVKFDATIENEAERDAAAKTKIDEIYKKAKAGDDFAQLAKDNSDDSTASNGGSLGWFDDSVSFVPEFKSAVFALENGAISEPIKTSFGYHIIKIDNIGSNANKTDLAEIKAKVSSKEISNILQEWYTKTKEKAVIQNYLTLEPEKQLVPPPPPAGK